MAEKKKRALPDNDRDWTPVDDLAWLGRLERLVRKVPKGAMARMHDYASELLASPMALPVGPMGAAQATQAKGPGGPDYAPCGCAGCVALRSGSTWQKGHLDFGKTDAQLGGCVPNGKTT